MIEVFRWYDYGQFHVHGDGMALVSPDFGMSVIEGISLFVVRANDFFQHLHGYRIFFLHTLQQFIYIGSAMAVQMNPDHLGLMSEDQAQKFADVY